MTADDMPPVRRNMLDELFTSFSLVADGTYTYVCDMKYDDRVAKVGVSAETRW